MSPIYFEEWADVLKACPQFRLNACLPVELGRPMADYLAHTGPALADQVWAFDGPQPLALSAFVLQAQALVVKGTRRPQPPTPRGTTR